MSASNIVDGLLPLACPIEELELLPGNPRRGDVEAVARSYQMFGQRKPIVAKRNGDKGVVIAGNHQLQAARSLGWSHIAVVWVDDDDRTAAAFALADNRTSDLGDYDDRLLAEMLSFVADDSALLEATAYSIQDLKDLLAEEPQPPQQPDSVPSFPTEAHSKRGDIWLLGPHRVMCGDSTVPTDVERLMAGGKAALVVTDPPYGVGYTGGQSSQRDALVNDTVDIFAGSLPQAASLSNPDAALYVWFAGSLGHYAYESTRSAGYTVRALIVWNKLNAHYGAYMSQYMPKHEPMLYCHKTGESPKWRGPTNEVTVWDCDQPTRNDWHPTQKPVALIKRAICNSSDPADIVLDLFGGSGSTLIAAHTTGRVARLMELDPRYVDVICRRYQEHTGVVPIAESTGEPHDFTVQALLD